MKTYIKNLLLIAIISTFSFGCVSFENRVPSKAIAKESTNLLYLTQRDSIPKDVVYRPIDVYQPTASNGQVSAQIDPAIVGAVLGAIPEISGTFLQVRNNVVLSDKELFIRGYDLNSEDITTLVNGLKSPTDSAK